MALVEGRATTPLPPVQEHLIKDTLEVLVSLVGQLTVRVEVVGLVQ